MTIIIRHDHYLHIGAEDARALETITAALAQHTKQLTKLTDMASAILGNLDDIFAKLKAQTTAISALDTLVQELADKLDAAIKAAPDLEAAAAKVAEIMAVVGENSEALIAAANINTPDVQPGDVEAVKEFESAPPQPLDKPEGA